MIISGATYLFFIISYKFIIIIVNIIIIHNA